MSSQQEWPLVRLSEDEMAQVVGSASSGGVIPPDVLALLPDAARALVIRVVC